MQYLVMASDGPTFASPQETLEVLEKGILPMFNHLLKLEADGVIVAGGLPVGDRAFVAIVETSSNDELDHILRNIPGWGVVKWQVTALQSFAGRENKEREVVQQLREML